MKIGRTGRVSTETQQNDQHGATLHPLLVIPILVELCRIIKGGNRPSAIFVRFHKERCLKMSPLFEMNNRPQSMPFSRRIWLSTSARTDQSALRAYSPR